jgi:hypothetical protein
VWPGSRARSPGRRPARTRRPPAPAGTAASLPPPRGPGSVGPAGKTDGVDEAR